MAELVGTPQAKQPTSAPNAWLGGNYQTIRLAADVDAVRVQISGGSGAARRDAAATVTATFGRWFAVGDVVLTESAYTNSRAQPSGASRVDWGDPKSTRLN